MVHVLFARYPPELKSTSTPPTGALRLKNPFESVFDREHPVVHDPIARVDDTLTLAIGAPCVESNTKPLTTPPPPSDGAGDARGGEEGGPDNVGGGAGERTAR